MTTVEITGKSKVAEKITIAQILAKGLKTNTLLTMEKADRLLAGETITLQIDTIVNARSLCQALNDLKMTACIASENEIPTA